MARPSAALTATLAAVAALALGGCTDPAATPAPASATAASQTTVDSFAACVAAGYPVMESYPRRCQAPDGQSFTEDIGNALELADAVRVSAPAPGTLVQSPLTVTGEARGPWFFEASLPVRLEDSAGTVLAEGPAQASSEWMTPEFVPFSATLSFTPPASGTGRLVVAKDNPSGLPENAAELVVPVRFGP